MRHFIPTQLSVDLSAGKLATNTNPHFARHTFPQPDPLERLVRGFGRALDRRLAKLGVQL